MTAAGYESWGRYPRAALAAVVPVRWRSEPPELARLPGPLLPRGYGRSYGDSCLNDGGVLLDVRPLARFIDFDAERGVLRCEAGVSLDAILRLVVPRGWFLPVVPGTAHVSVGGAIANDIHGKNHHRAGSFGVHVRRFELLRSSGERLVCSSEENPALFAATIGGLGLTGLILWAELALKPISGARIEMEQLRFSSLEGFFELAAESDRTHEYTVAWVDCLARGRRLGRGLFLRGDHRVGDAADTAGTASRDAGSRLRVPVEAPSRLLTSWTVRVFNAAYYRWPPRARVEKIVGYRSFFFPLDAVRDWNRMYGRAGFLQYQCVVPPEVAREAVGEILQRVARSREASFLAVLKNFGARPSPGLLSFPRAGTTLALDVPQRGARTLRLLDSLDAVVREAGGAVYPAKDARMSAASFERFFPHWRTFAEHVDPSFSSSFWRRVTAA